MEWHAVDARSLAIVDREVGPNNLTPAEYEIARRAIYATGDYDYVNLLRFSERALYAGAAALAARTTIVTDVPVVQAGVVPRLQKTFANPVYCAEETIVRPQKGKTQAAWGVHTLARRYPEAIFTIGSDPMAMGTLLEAMADESIRPPLVVYTAPGFDSAETAKRELATVGVPYICVEGRKGCAVVAVAVLGALIDLSWLAYKQESKNAR